MNAVVIDTNVPIVANGRSDQASAECVLACISALEDATTDGVVVLDDGMKILKEYMDRLSLSGQPGAGDLFMKWVWTNQAVPERCERVVIHERAGAFENYQQFPSDPALATFDVSDRKFVAVAVASTYSPPILNAVDSDWWDHRTALKRNGVTVRFLCPDCFEGE